MPGLRLLRREISRHLRRVRRHRSWAALADGETHGVRKFLKDIVDAFDQFGAAFNQIIRPTAIGTSMRPGTAKTSRPCSRRMAGCMQRAALVRGFDHQGAERQATDNTITARKIPAIGFGIEGKLRDRCPLVQIAS